MKARLFYCICTLLISAVSCSTGEEDQSIPSTDIDLLAGNITLSPRPDSAKWITFYPGGQPGGFTMGPTDHGVIACLKYSSEDFEKVFAMVDTSDHYYDNMCLDSTFVKDWFPPSIKQSFTTVSSTRAGKQVDCVVTKQRPYSLTPFSSTRWGFCIFTNDNRVLLSAQTH